MADRFPATAQLPAPWGSYAATSDGDIVVRRTGESVKTSVYAGYLHASLQGDGRRKTMAVHRWVALAFHGPCPHAHQVAHCNGVRTDNRPINLRYATREENHADRECHGTVYRGQRSPKAKLTNKQALHIRRRFALGEFNKGALAAEFGVSEGAINSLIRGESFRSVGGPRFSADEERSLLGYNPRRRAHLRAMGLIDGNNRLIEQEAANG